MPNSPIGAGSACSPARDGSGCKSSAPARSSCCGQAPARKIPTYSDVLYVDELIGPETVNTMPVKTMDAFRDHGTAARIVDGGYRGRDPHAGALERAGISLDSVTDQLVIEGVKLFSDSFDKLHEALAAKRRRFLGNALNEQTLALPQSMQTEIEQTAETWRSSRQTSAGFGTEMLNIMDRA